MENDNSICYILRSFYYDTPTFIPLSFSGCEKKQSMSKSQFGHFENPVGITIFQKVSKIQLCC